MKSLGIKILPYGSWWFIKVKVCPGSHLMNPGIGRLLFIFNMKMLIWYAISKNWTTLWKWYSWRLMVYSNDWCPGSQFIPSWACPYRSVIVEQLGHSEIIQCTLLITKQLLHFSTHPEHQGVKPSLQIGVKWTGYNTSPWFRISANKNLNPSHLKVEMQVLCYKQGNDLVS